MTLLEAVISFVLLALVGVACLDQSRGASQLQRSSAEWERAVAVADAALATATSGAASASDAQDASDNDAHVQITRTPWRGSLDQIEVRVPLAHGGTYVMSKLVPSANR